MTLDRLQTRACLPIPNPQFPLCIPRAQELAIGREVQPTGIPDVLVPGEPLLAVDLEPVLQVIDRYGVVHGLTHPVLAIGVHFCGGDGVHVGLQEVLDHDGDAELPGADLLLIGGRDEITAFVKEGDGVDAPGVFGFVFEAHVGFSGVVLEDVFVVVTDEERMLLGGVNCDTKRKSAIVIRVYNFSSLSIPFLHYLIQPRSNQLSPIFR